jgi:hypothetical protein
MIDTELDLPTRPVPDGPAVARDGRCPDCGSPLGVTGDGHLGCLLCGTWRPDATDRSTEEVS